MSIKNIIKKTEPYAWLIVLFVVSLVYILDPRFFTNPPLRSDDWNMLVEPTVFGSFSLVDLTNRRPFMMALYALVSPIFQLHITLYYVLNWLLILVSSVVVYGIVHSAFERYRWLALPTALVFLIYPANYARTWLVIQINTFALLLALIAIWLIVRYLKSGKAWKLVLANILILLSLGTYEAGLGLILATGLAVLILARSAPLKRRLWTQTAALTVALFVLWRAVLQPLVLNVSDDYLASTIFSIAVLLERFVQGAFIFLFNWLGPLLLKFQDAKYGVFLGIVLLIVVIYLVLAWPKLKRLRTGESEAISDRKAKISDLFSISLLGLIFWAAGYIPVIFLYQPIFYGDGSRVNFAAIPGASLALVALLSALIAILIENQATLKKGVFVAVIPLVVLGVAYQCHNQNVRFQVWRQNEDFWNQMFTLVPGIESETKVVIVIPGYQKLEPFELMPFRGDWEAEAALRVLYNDDSLFAEYYYQDTPNLADNWVPVCDLERFIFVFYDPQTTQIRLIDDPSSAIDFPCEVLNYHWAERLIDFEEGMGAYRWLVE